MNTQPTHPWLRSLIVALCAIRIVSVLLDPYLFYIGIPETQTLFALSGYATNQGWIWQPFTYFFFQWAPQGITLFFLISLSFRMYFLWMMGQSIIDRYGPKRFLSLFLCSAFGAGIITFFSMFLLGPKALLIGCTPSLLALFVIWTLMHPNATILLFFVIPMRTRTLLSLALGGALLISFSQGDPFQLISLFSGAFVGYLFATAGFQLRSPYECMQKWDEKAVQLGDFIREKLSWITRKFQGDSATIIDINTGKTRKKKDSQFVDEMLDKISKSGKSSLSFWESIKLRFVSWRMRNGRSSS